MTGRAKTVANLRVGRPDVRPDDPAHVKGVRQGNAVGNYRRQAGQLPDGRATAARSTGVNPHLRDVIDRRMPRLYPA